MSWFDTKATPDADSIDVPTYAELMTRANRASEEVTRLTSTLDRVEEKLIAARDRIAQLETGDPAGLVVIDETHMFRRAWLNEWRQVRPNGESVDAGRYEAQAEELAAQCFKAEPPVAVRFTDFQVRLSDAVAPGEIGVIVPRGGHQPRGVSAEDRIARALSLIDTWMHDVSDSDDMLRRAMWNNVREVRAALDGGSTS